MKTIEIVAALPRKYTTKGGKQKTAYSLRFSGALSEKQKKQLEDVYIFQRGSAWYCNESNKPGMAFVESHLTADAVQPKAEKPKAKSTKQTKSAEPNLSDIIKQLAALTSQVNALLAK